jgi:hypothetical protein
MKPRGPTFKGCAFNDNKTAIRLHGDSTIDVKDSELLRNGIAVDHVVEGSFSEAVEPPVSNGRRDGRSKTWYEKPPGIIALSVVAGFIVWAVLALCS